MFASFEWSNIYKLNYVNVALNIFYVLSHIEQNRTRYTVKPLQELKPVAQFSWVVFKIIVLFNSEKNLIH